MYHIICQMLLYHTKFRKNHFFYDNLIANLLSIHSLMTYLVIWKTDAVWRSLINFRHISENDWTIYTWYKCKQC